MPVRLAAGLAGIPVAVMRGRIDQSAPPGKGSPRLSKSQVDALPSEQRVFAVGKRRYAMEKQPRRPAPYHDIAMLQPVALRLVAAFGAAEHEDGGQAQRDRHDGRGVVLFVLV